MYLFNLWNGAYNGKENYLAMKKKIENSPILYTVLSVFLCLDVALLIIGSVDFKKCPIDEGVTYYLVMQGIVSAAGKLVPVINRKVDSFMFYYLSWLLNCMTFGLLIKGCIVIYSIYKPNFDKEIGLYCSKPAYLMGFSYLTIHWILISIFFIIICITCFGICYYLSKMESDDQQPQNTQNNTNRARIDTDNLS